MPLRKQLFRYAMLLLAAAGSVIVGFYAGIFISAIGEDTDGSSLIARGVAFICPMVAVASSVSRRWLLAVVAYAFGFYHGYTAFDGLGDSVGAILGGVAAVLSAPSAWLSGSNLPIHQTIASSGFQAHPELAWYLDLAVLLVSIAAILRYQRRTSTTPNKPCEATGDNVSS